MLRSLLLPMALALTSEGGASFARDSGVELRDLLPPPSYDALWLSLASLSRWRLCGPPWLSRSVFLPTTTALLMHLANEKVSRRALLHLIAARCGRS
eukprot:3257759-Rhodomonas_salina.2